MIYIALGSNLGNRLGYLRHAVQLLRSRVINNLETSVILETEAIIRAGGPEAYKKPYLNMIVRGQSHLTPQQLLAELKNIEHALGRPKDHDKWSPRTIDLDILMFNDQIINEKNLKIPHPELKNRPFLLHLLSQMGNRHLPVMLENKPFLKAFALEPALVGIVNVTEDSFSDGGLFGTTKKAVARSLALIEDGASVIDIGAQSTRPDASIIGAEAEYKILSPILNELHGQGLKISIDTFWDEVILKLLEKYNIDWINDVKGDLREETLKQVAQKGCHILTMHSLAIPARKDICIDRNTPPITSIMDWAKRAIERLLQCGFSMEHIIIDPGIGFSKDIYQDIALLRDVEELRKLGCQILIGHSRKFFMTGFTNSPPIERDIETIAISSILKNQVDFLRVHNVQDHMRFFVAQEIVDILK